MADAAKKVSELLAPDIIAHTRIYQDAESAIKKYFHFDSKLMRAIHKHIGYAKDCVLIDRPADICHYSECGAAVHFKDITVWGTQWKYNDETKRNEPYEIDYFGLDITVEYHDENEDRDVTRQYTINVPIDLEINFTEEKFNVWINELAQKRNLEREEKDKEAIKALLKKYPQWGNPLISGA